MTRHYTFTAAAVLTLSVSGSAGGQTTVIPYNHLPSGNHGTMTVAWMVRATDHFNIFYGGQHEAAVDAIAIEAERAYARVSFDLGHDLTNRVPLILVPSGRDVPQDGGQARELVRVSGAPDGDHLVLPIEPVDDRASLLVHELTHQFAFELIPLSGGIPAWIHEALSDHETGTWTPSELVDCAKPWLEARCRPLPATRRLIAHGDTRCSTFWP